MSKISQGTPSTGNGRSGHSRPAESEPYSGWQSDTSRPVEPDRLTERGGLLARMTQVLSGHYRKYHCAVCGLSIVVEGPRRKDSQALNHAGWTRWDKLWRCPLHRHDRMVELDTRVGR